MKIQERSLKKSEELWERAQDTILSGCQLYSKGPETHIKGFLLSISTTAREGMFGIPMETSTSTMTWGLVPSCSAISIRWWMMPSWRSCDGAWATPSSHPRKSSTQSFACSTFQEQARCGFSKRDRPRRRQLCALHGAIRDATILFAVSITVGMSGRRRRRAFGRAASYPRCVSSSINLTTTISQRSKNILLLIPARLPLSSRRRWKPSRRRTVSSSN